MLTISSFYFTTYSGLEYGSVSLQYYIFISVKTHVSRKIPCIYNKDDFNQFLANWSKKQPLAIFRKYMGIHPSLLGLINTPSTFACFPVLL